jgi:membrane fusion protein, adhesin transport system
VRYGTLTAEVTFVSPDTVGSDLHDPYRVNLAVESNPDWVRETGVELAPGMSVEVDIIAGKRRVIEYLTDPIQRAFQTAFREI